MSQAWANELAITGTFEHNLPNKCGENLYRNKFVGQGDHSGLKLHGAKGVKAWYDEIKIYNFAKGQFSKATGNEFTEIVKRLFT